MQPYQEMYIANCRAVRTMTGFLFQNTVTFDQDFDEAMDAMRRAQKLSQQNMNLLQEYLLPVLDDLYSQEEEVLQGMEKFADQLTSGPLAVDVALACQIHEALLNRARRAGTRETVIRELYKLGMARYAMWYMISGLDLPEAAGFSTRMRYCFVEASSYLKYFDEFPDETKAYILRSLSNIYIGDFDRWEDKLACVRRTMQVFTDEHYRQSAPNLPWGAYMNAVHRQMVGVFPHKLKGGSIPPDTIADVMESAHLVYEGRPKEGDLPLARNQFPYHALEYRCGFISKERFLQSIEKLMDEGDPTAFDEDSQYRILSLPAFYALYLHQSPQLIPPRREYIVQLYRRLLDYLQAIPPEAISDQLRLYVRQILSEFAEVEGGPSYRELAQISLALFSPDLFAHGYSVGKMAQALCATMLEQDPSLFSDIPELQALAPGGEMSAAVQELAYHSGLFHDLGKINFSQLYNHAGRQMLRSEEEALQLHASAGWLYLKEHDSTRQYADVARGHHRWYDGSDGYPLDFTRKSSPYRVMVDVVAFADYLDSEEEDSVLPTRAVSFEEKIAQALKLEGHRFSPLVTGWLRTPELLGQLKELYQTGRREGYYLGFRFASRAKK